MDPTDNNGLSAFGGFMQGLAGGVGQNMKFEHERRMEELAALRAQRQMRGYGQTVPGDFMAKLDPDWDPQSGDAPLQLATAELRNNQLDANSERMAEARAQAAGIMHGPKGPVYDESKALAITSGVLKNAGLSFDDPTGAAMAEKLMNGMRLDAKQPMRAYTTETQGGGMFGFGGGPIKSWAGPKPQDFTNPAPAAKQPKAAAAAPAPDLPDDTGDGQNGDSQDNAGGWTIK